jgi:outer membrane protein assembly factor BamB
MSAMRQTPWIPWVLAVAVTAVATALAYPWGYCLITWLLTRTTNGTMLGRLLAGLAVLAAVGVLTVWLVPERSRRGWIGAVALGWFALVNGGILWLRMAPLPWSGLAIVAYMLGSSAIVWAALFPLWPVSAVVRGGVLTVFLGGLGLFLGGLEAQGLTGDAQVAFRWRSGRRPAEAIPVAGPAPESVIPPTKSLEPTPDDFPQYLGPDRDGRLPERRLARDWTTVTPRELWRRRVGEGWGGFAVVGTAAITQEQRGPYETVVCYDADTGAELWVHADPIRFDSSLGGVGPRGTPTVVGGRIYTMGATGRLNCLDAAGQVAWAVDTVAGAGAAATTEPRAAGGPSAGEAEPEATGELTSHGMTGSPLVVEGRVYVCPCGRDGRSLAAYDAATGRLLFREGVERASYTSPTLHVLAGRPQILVHNGGSVAGHDPETGRVLWSFPWTNDQRTNCGQPLVLADDRVLASTGYGGGSAAFVLRPAQGGGLQPEQLWRSRDLKSKFASPVLLEGFVYGLDDGILVCLDPATGTRRWKRGRYGHGQLLLVGDLLLVQTEPGPIVLVEPRPDGPVELGTIPALSAKTWNTLAVAGRRLLARNAVEAVCYELPAPPDPLPGVAVRD